MEKFSIEKKNQAEEEKNDCCDQKSKRGEIELENREDWSNYYRRLEKHFKKFQSLQSLNFIIDNLIQIS